MMDKGMGSFILVSGFLAFLAGSFVFLFSLWELSGGFIPGINTPLLTNAEWATGFAPSGFSWDEILRHSRTNVFASVVAFELMFVWNCRDEYNPVWKTSIRESKTLIGAVILSLIPTMSTIYVPFLQPIFETVARRCVRERAVRATRRKPACRP